MTDKADIEKRFWKALKHDRTVMMGSNQVPARPMTALVDDDMPGIIWVFTAKQNELAKQAKVETDVFANFVSKGHDTFANIMGTLSISNDREVIDKLWSPFVAAWFKGGKDDPDLVLMRIDPSSAEVWIDGSSLLAGVQILLGMDPKTTYKDKVATIDM